MYCKRIKSKRQFYNGIVIGISQFMRHLISFLIFVTTAAAIATKLAENFGLYRIEFSNKNK